jgi:hypothetical protein
MNVEIARRSTSGHNRSQCRDHGLPAASPLLRILRCCPNLSVKESQIVSQPSIQLPRRRLALLTLAGLIVAVAVAIWLGPGNGSSAIRTKLTPEQSRYPAVPTAEPCDSYAYRTDPLLAESTRQVIAAFLSAYNAGAPDITYRFIAPTGEFLWYGAPDRVFPDNPASMDRETLPTYFAAEHARGERLELREFNFLGARYYRDVRAWRLDSGLCPDAYGQRRESESGAGEGSARMHIREDR